MVRRTTTAALVARPSTIVATVLEGTTEDTAEADRIAREALDYIARLERRAHLELVVEIGDYLVKTFFGGDLELARSLRPDKPVALSRLMGLAATRDIPETRLRYSIGLSVQYRALPESVRDRLSFRQHRALLPVKDPRAKSRLARRAISEKLGSDELTRIVRTEMGPSNAGRKPRPELELAVTAARRILGASTLEADMMPGRLRALPAESRDKVRRDAIVIRERIEKILDGLK